MSLIQLMDQRTILFECDVAVHGSACPHVVLVCVGADEKGAHLRLSADEARDLADRMIREAGAVEEIQRLEAMLNVTDEETPR